MKKFLFLIVYCLPLLAGLQAPARAQRTKLSVQQGGTGDTVLAPRYGVMLGDSLDPVIVLAPGDTNFVLTSRGPGFLPAWLPASGGVSQVYGLAPIFVNGGDTIGIGSIAFADSSRASHYADSAGYVANASGQFIQNGTSLQTGANFNIDGNGIVGGTFASGSSVATGTNSFAAGLSSNALADQSIALGNGNIVNSGATSAIVVGGGCVTSDGAPYSLALGISAWPQNAHSIVIGDGSTVTSDSGVNQFVARASKGFLLHDNVAQAIDSGLTFRNDTLAVNGNTIYPGGGGGSSLWQLGGGAYPFPAIVPVGDSSVVVTGSAANLYVFNNGTAETTGYGNILFGDGADDGPLSVTGNGNIAGGTGITITDGYYSIAVGDVLTVDGGRNAVFGVGNVEVGSDGLMSGNFNTDTGSYDFTAGEQNQILSGSSNAVALGGDNVSSGGNAVSIGGDDSAFGTSVAIGTGASALNNIVINSTNVAYVSNPVTFTVNLGADSGLYVFTPGNPVPELLVNGGTLSSQGTQLTDNTGRVLNGGNGAVVGFGAYPYVYQGDSIASDDGVLVANVIAFNQSPTYPLQTVAVAGTYLSFNPSDTTGEGGNPITVNIGGTGMLLNIPALSTTYGDDDYDVSTWSEIKVAGTIGGNPFEGWLSNGGYGNVFVLTDMLGVPITTAIQGGDAIFFTDGTFNVQAD